MGRREVAHAHTQQEAFDFCIRRTAAGDKSGSSVEELAGLSGMRARGDITDEEFVRAKGLILTGGVPAGRATSITTDPGR
ncbi:SHOCT domain-containing protein [Streptomyces sp. NPDC003697]